MPQDVTGWLRRDPGRTPEPGREMSEGADLIGPRPPLYAQHGR